MNPLGINLWNWCAGLGPDCLGLPARAARMGFTAIELPMTVPEVFPALRQELAETGLSVTLCAALGPGRDLSSFDPAVRSATMDYLTACLEAGRALGAGVLCGPLYAGGGKRHWLDPADKKREWELAVTGLRELARRAADCGMALSLEPLNRYRTSVCNTSAQVLELIGDIGAPNVGLHFDTYHACLEEKDLTGALEAALRSGRVNHFHACANNRGAPGQGILPLGEGAGPAGPPRLLRPHHHGDLCPGRAGQQLDPGARGSRRSGPGGPSLPAGLFQPGLRGRRRLDPVTPIPNLCEKGA